MVNVVAESPDSNDGQNTSQESCSTKEDLKEQKIIENSWESKRQKNDIGTLFILFTVMCNR